MKTKTKNNINLENLKSDDITSIIDTIKSNCTSKMDETIDAIYEIDMDVKKESVRSSVLLSKGIKKSQECKICLFTNDTIDLSGHKNIFICNEEEISNIKTQEKLDAHICLTDSTFFPKLVPIAKILSANKLMPNNKEGTVVNNLLETALNIQNGKLIKFKNDSAGYIQVSIGKQSQDTNDIINNLQEITQVIKSFNKDSKKSNFIKTIKISSTMGKFSLKAPLKAISKK